MNPLLILASLIGGALLISKSSPGGGKREFIAKFHDTIPMVPEYFKIGFRKFSQQATDSEIDIIYKWFSEYIAKNIPLNADSDTTDPFGMQIRDILKKYNNLFKAQ